MVPSRAKSLTWPTGGRWYSLIPSFSSSLWPPATFFFQLLSVLHEAASALEPLHMLVLLPGLLSPSLSLSSLSFFFFYYFIFLTSLLEYDCFTMLCQFLLYNKVNQLYVYIYPHIPSLLHLPSTLPIPPLKVDTTHRADLPVLCSCFPLAIYFTFGTSTYF